MMEKALVVDGDFLMRGHVVDSLEKEGVSVMEAASRAEARRLLEHRHYDLVFSDLDIYGTRIPKEFGNSPKDNANVVYVVMTSFSMVERAIEAVRNGAYDYLVKPFSLDQVTVIVSRAREVLKLRTQIGLLEERVDQTGSSSVKSPTVTTSALLSTLNLQELERQTIFRAMHETGGRRGVMAEKLGISVRTLRNKLTQYKQESALQMP